MSDGIDELTDDGAFEYKPAYSDPWSEGNETVKALILQRPALLQSRGEDG